MAYRDRPNASTERATIQDVARAAGVSTGTVSRVINNRKGVHIRTREAVLAAMERLAYQPDLAARELSFRQAPRIGLSFPRGHRKLAPFMTLFGESLSASFASDGFHLVEIAADEDGLPLELTDAMVLFGAHDGDPRPAFLERSAVPFVLIGHTEGVRWVAPDDRDGGFRATEHLARLGHERILVVGGRSGQAEIDRFEGYRDALEAADLSYDPDLSIDGGPTPLDAYRAVRRLLGRGLNFSAVFALSDERALGAVAALEDGGRRVPTDVSVVGFDDLPEIGSQLTTIRQDIPEIAATAAKLLQEAMRDEPIRQVRIPVELVRRSTSARRR